MPDFRQVQVQQDSGVTVLSLMQSRIHDQESIKQLGEELNAITVDQEHNQLLFDMSGVEFVSSAVLNRLIVLDKQLKNSGGQLAFSSLHPQVAEVFSITRLNQLFPIYETRQEAIDKISNGS